VTLVESCMIGIAYMLDYTMRQAIKACEGAQPKYVVLHPQLIMQLRSTRSMDIEYKERAYDSDIVLYYRGVPVIEKVAADYPFLRDATGASWYL